MNFIFDIDNDGQFPSMIDYKGENVHVFSLHSNILVFVYHTT